LDTFAHDEHNFEFANTVFELIRKI
jgi:hypothetical protein